MRLSPEIIEKLVSLGKLLEEGHSKHVCFNILELKSLSGSIWHSAAKDLTTNKLCGLIRFLTLMESFPEWSHGSVSPVISLFKILRARDATQAEETADWVLAHTKNPWVPFGSQNFGAKSLSEYNKKSRQRSEKISQGLLLEKESEVRALEERALRQAQRNRAARDRRSSIRGELLIRVKGISIHEALEIITKDNTYPPNFYPTSIANGATTDILKALPRKTRILLLTKMKGRFKGPWGKMKKRLSQVEPFPWDRAPWF